MRSPFAYGVIALLLLVLVSPASALAAKRMLVQATVNSTQTEDGAFIVMSGRVFEAYNVSVPNAVISILVNNPQGTSIRVTVAYTSQEGVFRDSFLLPPNSPAGNYTAYLVVEKTGYETARLTLSFAFSTPDFSIESSTSTVSLRQGQSGTLTITLLALRGFDKPVNLTGLDMPTGVSLQFSPQSLVPSGTTVVNVLVSNSAPVGNYTVTVLAISGSLNHKTSFQLMIGPGPYQNDFMLLTGGAGTAAIGLAAALLLVRSRGKRKRKEAVLEELIKQASADSGYVATARVIAKLEELRAMDKVDEPTYQRLKRDYEKRLEKSK